MNSLGEPREKYIARAWRVDRQCLAALRELQFEYLVFLNTAIPVVAVVEMGRRSEHRYVVLHPLLPPSAEGKKLMPMSVLPPVSSLRMATDAQGPEPDEMLGAMLCYVNYLHPCFDIRHVDFEAEFFGDDEEDVGLPEYTTASYEAAKDRAPIFIQGRDNVGFSAADLLKFYMDSQAKRMEDYISEHERRPESSTFTIPFPINFTEGSFYMNTVDGRRYIRKLKLVVEIIVPEGKSRMKPQLDVGRGRSKLSAGR